MFHFNLLPANYFLVLSLNKITGLFVWCPLFSNLLFLLISQHIFNLVKVPLKNKLIKECIDPLLLSDNT